MRKVIFCVLVGLLLGLCGCAAKNELVVIDENGIYPLDGMERAYKADASFYDMEEQGAAGDGPCRRADEIGAFVANMAKIEGAVCALSGNTAIIGIQPAKSLNKKEVVALKRKVMENVPAFDRSVSRVAVTELPDLYERINALATQ